MHDLLASWFANPTFLLVYLGLLAAVLIVPMIWLSRWYHRSIRNTPGGRKLMRWQSQNTADGAGAAEAARDIARGAYGQTAKTMQRRVFVFVGWWLLAVAALATPAIYFTA